MRYGCAVIGMLSLLQAVVSAGPRIAVDTPVYDLGRVFDSRLKPFKHTFKVRNTGDAPLVISSIRTSCGCTSVAFDSVIPPNGSGSITEEVVVEEGASPGEFAMPISVISDARNTPILRIAMRGVLEFLIETDPVSFVLNHRTGQDTAEALLILRSNLKGLTVTGVSFSFTEKNNAFSWKSSLPLSYSFSTASASDLTEHKPHQPKNKKWMTIKPPPKVKYTYSYALRIRYPAVDQLSRSGDLIIRTSHPEKPELRMSGLIVIQ